MPQSRAISSQRSANAYETVGNRRVKILINILNIFLIRILLTYELQISFPAVLGTMRIELLLFLINVPEIPVGMVMGILGHSYCIESSSIVYTVHRHICWQHPICWHIFGTLKKQHSWWLKDFRNFSWERKSNIISFYRLFSLVRKIIVDFFWINKHLIHDMKTFLIFLSMAKIWSLTLFLRILHF